MNSMRLVAQPNNLNKLSFNNMKKYVFDLFFLKLRSLSMDHLSFFIDNLTFINIDYKKINNFLFNIWNFE